MSLVEGAGISYGVFKLQRRASTSSATRKNFWSLSLVDVI